MDATSNVTDRAKDRPSECYYFLILGQVTALASSPSGSLRTTSLFISEMSSTVFLSQFTTVGTRNGDCDRLCVHLNIVLWFVLNLRVCRAVSLTLRYVTDVTRCHHGPQNKCLHCVPYEVSA